MIYINNSQNLAFIVGKYTNGDKKVMFCRFCGEKNEDEAIFCKKCGSNIRLNNKYNNTYTNGQYSNFNANQIENKPLSMWVYFAYRLLFAIPIVGIIAILIIGLGNTRNINLRNYAKSYLCEAIIVLVMFLLSLITSICINMSL